MAALQVKQICMYLELADLTKYDQYKIRSRIYIQKYMVPKSFKKYHDGKCSQSTFSMPKAKTITQIRPDDQSKGERKAQRQRQ